jgi:hypothetical protein
MKTFEEAWAEKVAAGYQYGEDALEQVRFGWEMRAASELEDMPRRTSAEVDADAESQPDALKRAEDGAKEDPYAGSRPRVILKCTCERDDHISPDCPAHG